MILIKDKALWQVVQEYDQQFFVFFVLYLYLQPHFCCIHYQVQAHLKVSIRLCNRNCDVTIFGSPWNIGCVLAMHVFAVFYLKEKKCQRLEFFLQKFWLLYLYYIQTVALCSKKTLRFLFLFKFSTQTP